MADGPEKMGLPQDARDFQSRIEWGAQTPDYNAEEGLERERYLAGDIPLPGSSHHLAGVHYRVMGYELQDGSIWTVHAVSLYRRDGDLMEELRYDDHSPVGPFTVLDGGKTKPEAVPSSDALRVLDYLAGLEKQGLLVRAPVPEALRDVLETE